MRASVMTKPLDDQYGSGQAEQWLDNAALFRQAINEKLKGELSCEELAWLADAILTGIRIDINAGSFDKQLQDAREGTDDNGVEETS